MRLFGYELNVRRAAPVAVPGALVPRVAGPVVQEPYPGAWQRNDPLWFPSLLASPPVFTCTSRIAHDIAKLRVRLVRELEPDVWTPASNPAYSPVLRKPNHYQTMAQLLEQWISSKLNWGNTYILKRRDLRGVVDALYVLNPQYVTPLLAVDGSIYYELRRPDTDPSGAWREGEPWAPLPVPAREIIHDRWNCLFHPLVGIPPLWSAALAAQQGLTMQEKATNYFSTGSQPNGVLIMPGHPSKQAVADLQTEWNARKGGIAVISGDLKYEQLSFSSVDSQFVEQLNFTTEQVAMIYGLPYILLDSSKGGQAFGNNEPVIQLYHDECLQTLMNGVEDGFDEGLEFAPGSGYGVELDVDDLLWMDTDSRVKAAGDVVKNGIMTTNEARRKYFGLPPVAGGDSIMLQQQYYALAALARRDAEQPAPRSGSPAPADEGGGD